MSPQAKSTLLHILVTALVVAAFGLAGSDDYAEAKRQEQVTCAHQPTPEFCRHVE